MTVASGPGQDKVSVEGQEGMRTATRGRVLESQQLRKMRFLLMGVCPRSCEGHDSLREAISLVEARQHREAPDKALGRNQQVAMRS